MGCEPIPLTAGVFAACIVWAWWRGLRGHTCARAHANAC
jgi:hypothetical protein